jgi:hypothetical protein
MTLTAHSNGSNFLIFSLPVLIRLRDGKIRADMPFNSLTCVVFFDVLPAAYFFSRLAFK